MSRTMTCWKEIAQYLGKGVRTVQRWARILGLPVHRPNGRPNGFVLALSDELDAWMLSSCEGGPVFELDALRRQVAELTEQNEFLRAKLERAERIPSFVSLNAFSDVEDWTDKVLRRRCSAAIERSHAIRQQSLHLLDMMRSMQEYLKMQREQRAGILPNCS